MTLKETLKQLFKLLALYFFFCYSVFTSLGQNISIATDKNEYWIDETIEITFEINARVDSIEFTDSEYFTIANTPVISNSTSFKNGNIEYSNKWVYRLRPIKPGEVLINSPVFHVKGQAFEGKPVSVKVINRQLTEEELEQKRFDSFVKDNFKPMGTYRYTFKGEFGYLERYGKWGWEFHRKLTTEEIEIIKKIQ